MAYTLLDAAYEMYYPKAEFAKNPFSRKKKPGMLKRARQVVLGKTKRGFAARAIGVAGALRYGGAAKKGFTPGGSNQMGGVGEGFRNVGRSVRDDVQRLASKPGRLMGR